MYILVFKEKIPKTMEIKQSIEEEAGIVWTRTKNDVGNTPIMEKTRKKKKRKAQKKLKTKIYEQNN